MHARQVTPIVRQRREGILVADVAEVHAEVGFPAQQFSQLRNREPMARVHPDDRRAVREKLVDLGFQFLRKVLELRSQTSLQALSGPHQFAAESGQAGAASLLTIY